MSVTKLGEELLVDTCQVLQHKNLRKILNTYNLKYMQSHLMLHVLLEGNRNKTDSVKVASRLLEYDLIWYA